MRQVNIVVGPIIAVLGLVVLAAVPVLGEQGCLVGSLTTSACGTGGNLMAVLGITVGVTFLLFGYAAFARGLTGH